jgi:hypothetical protein
MNRWVKWILFHLRWILMSSERRYAYLWARTIKLGGFGHAFRNAAARASELGRVEDRSRAGASEQRAVRN